MKAVFGLMTGVLIATSAHAADPWTKMLGKYTLPADCFIDGNDGFEKAVLRVARDGKFLELKAYKGSREATQLIPIQKFEDEDGSSDGHIFYDVVQKAPNALVSTEKFVRHGSDTWPDLEMLQAYSLSLQGDNLTYKYSSQTGRQKKPSVQTCVLTRASKSADSVEGQKLEQFANPALAQLAAAVEKAATAKMDLDQSAFQVAQLQLNKTHLTDAQWSEVLNLYADMSGTENKYTEMKSYNPDELAAKGLRTVLGIIEGSESKPEYAPLLNLKKTVAQALTNTQLKIIFVEWDSSDASGEGLLWIDSTTGETFYMGSGYFE